MSPLNEARPVMIERREEVEESGIRRGDDG